MKQTSFVVVVIVAVVLSLVAGACATRNEPKPAPPEVVASLQDEALQQARLELQRGERLAAEGEWAAARLAFDRASDLLLFVPGGVESNEEARKLYDRVLATIVETDRIHQSVLAEEIAVAEPSVDAAVDSLTSDVSELHLEELDEGEVESADVPEASYNIPIVRNARVQSIIEMFQERRHEWFQEALDRSGHYLPLIHEVFSEEGVPTDLAYLAMVESAFKERAVSRAGARGMWQFIQGTGRLYGLRQTFWVDDRFNSEKATRAAARHLKDLYEDFGDWYLAMAAYNAGARRVERAIRRSGGRDFWEMSRRRLLPRETRSYVPLIIAATIIAKDPEAYGFTPSPHAPREYDVVRLDHPVDLETAARSMSADVDTLKLLNPELRRWVTPLDSTDYPLKVPKGKSSEFRAALDAIPPEDRVRFGTHVVRRGDTLSRIALRYGTTVSALTAANRVGRRSLIHPGQVLTVPVPPGSRARDVMYASEARSRDSVSENGREVYVVRRGDTLGAIATSFRLPLSELRNLNGLGSRESTIHPGQRLVVGDAGSAPARTRTAQASSSSPSSPPIPSGTGVYVVRPGDTLGQIAEAHGMGLSVLRRLNGMGRRSSRIYPGQELIVQQSAAVTAQSSPQGPVVYRIRRGDTLSKIATRFGVSIADLRRWNGMSSDRIVAGDSLTIHAGTN